MRTIAITVNKGGVGKTTLSKSIATAAVLNGLTAMIIDLDTQQNSTRWGRRRAQQPGKPLPLVRFTTENDLDAEIAQARIAGCDVLLIDTPPGRSSEAAAAIEAADLVVIPCMAEDVDSFEGIARTARVARTSGKRAIGLLNGATPGAKHQEGNARGVVEAIGIGLVPVVLHRYAAHREANTRGLTAQESHPGSRASNELAALWSWVSAELQIGRPAVPRRTRR